MKNKILITGGEGRFAQVLKKKYDGIFANTSGGKRCLFGHGQTCCVTVCAVLVLFFRPPLLVFVWVCIIPWCCAFFCIIFPFLVVGFGDIVVVCFVSFFLMCLCRVVSGVCGPFWLLFPYFFCARV